MIFDDLLTHYNVKNRTFINYEKSMKLVHIFKRRAPAFWCYVFLTQWGPERASQLKKGGVVQWLVLHFVDAMRLRFLMFVISICFFLFVCLFAFCQKKPWFVLSRIFPILKSSIGCNQFQSSWIQWIFFLFWGDAEANSLTTCWQMSSGLHPSRPRHLRAQTTWPRCLGLTWTVC